MNEINKRFQYLREAIGFYIRLLFCQMGAEAIILLSSGALAVSPNMGEAEMMEVMLEMLSQNSYRMIIITYLLMAVILFYRRQKQPGEPLVLVDGPKQPIRLGEAFWGVVMGAAGCLWAAILMELMGGQATPYEAHVSQSMEVLSQSAEPMWLQFIAVVLFSSIFEEYIFRGLIFSRFRMIMPPMGALLCQAFTFASMYMGGVASAGAMVTGTIMGLVVMKTGSLRAAIIVRMAYNLMSFTANPMYDAIFASADTTKTIFAVSAVFFALGAIFFFCSGTKKSADKSE